MNRGNQNHLPFFVLLMYIVLARRVINVDMFMREFSVR